MRIYIDRGFYVQPVNVASQTKLYDLDSDVTYPLLFQTYEMDGSKATGNYSGVGTITHDGRIILGDLSDPTSFLTEYRVSNKPDPESERDLDEYVAGFEAGYRGKRKSSKRGYAWHDGFKDGKHEKERRI